MRTRAVSGRGADVIRYIDRMERGPVLPRDAVGIAAFGYMHGAADAREGALSLEDMREFIAWLTGDWRNWRLPHA